MEQTAFQLITRSMKLIGAIASNETPQAAEAIDGLQTLNEMIDSWATQRLTIYVVPGGTDHVLVVGQQDYTIGPTGADFTQQRPIWIDRAGIISLNDQIQPLELPMQIFTMDQWGSIPVKNVDSALPMYLFYNRNYPNGTIRLWPIPSVGNLSIRLYTPTALSVFPNLNTPFDFPPGYVEAIRTNLAVKLAPEYGRPVDPALYQLASEALANIKRANITMDDLVVDEALLRRSDLFDYRTGDPL